MLVRLVGAYRRIGVRRAEVARASTRTLGPALALVAVHWRLLGAEDRLLYEFDAVYTVADLGDGPRICAIAHNEGPRLRALVESPAAS